MCLASVSASKKILGLRLVPGLTLSGLGLGLGLMPSGGPGTVQPADVQRTEFPLKGWSKVPRSCGIRPNAFCVMSKAFPRKHQNIEISFLSLELFSITFKNILLALLGRRRSLELGPAELFIPH